MALAGLFARRAQAPTTYTSDASGLGRTGSMSACALATIAALGLIICAASQNVTYGWQVGSARSETAGYILAGGALAAAVMAPVCWAVAIVGRGTLIRLAALFLGCWCLAYGVTASLGFVSTSRHAAISGHQADVDAYADRRAVAAAARTELATLAAVKTPSRAVIERRRELTKILAAPIAATAPAKAVIEADPRSPAIAGYLQALGWAATTDKVSLWLNAFMVTFFEVASALALSVAAALYPSTRQTHLEGPPAAVSAPRPIPCRPSPRRPPARPERSGTMKIGTIRRRRPVRRGVPAVLPRCCQRKLWTSCARPVARTASGASARCSA